MAATLSVPRPARAVGSTDARHLAFRPDIEGMRAVAVLLVVLSHAGVPLVHGGYIGVDIFFVISGFLITSLLVRERRKTGAISIRRFYARRATRLLPLAVLVTVVTLIASWLWLPATRFRTLAGDAIASTLYAINYRLALQNTDYLNAEEPPSPFQHFWSLAVEEQFYLGWPLLLIVVALLWPVRRKSYVWPLAVVLCLVVAASLTASVVQTVSAMPWAYFGIHTRAWELGLGALVALGAARLARCPSAVAAVLTWLGLAMIVAAALSYNTATVFPGYAAVLPVSGAALVIAGGCAAPRGGAQLMLGTAPLQRIGRLSYGWYLWHWPVLLIGPAALGIEAGVGVNLALMVVALLISMVTFRWVENPVRYRKSLTLQPLRGLSVGAALSVIAVTTALVAALVVPPAAVGEGTAKDTAEVVAGASDPEAALVRLVADSADATRIPANLAPDLLSADAAIPKVYGNGCHLELADVRTPDSCVFGDPDGERTMVLLGDSHAAQWFPVLDRIAAERGWKLVSMTKSACPAASVHVINTILKRSYDECRQWRADSLNRIAAMAPELVVMSASNRNTLVGETDDPDRRFVDGWTESFRTVAGDGTRLVMIADTPWAKTKVPDCVASHPDAVHRCAQSPDAAERLPERRRKVIDAATAEGVEVIDPFPWLCTDRVCPVVVGNLLVYRDAHHLTTAYVEMLSRVLAVRLPLES